MPHIKKLSIISISIVLLIGLAAGLINVNIVSDPPQITVGGESNIIVNVTDDNSTPQENITVNFTLNSIGNLNATSAITDSSGYAAVRIDSTVAGIATVNASVGSDTNTTNVTFLPEKPARIDINVSDNPLVVGNTSIVVLTLYDMYNNINSTAEVNINVSITDVLGKLKYYKNFTIIPSNITDLQIDHIGVSQTDDMNISSLQVVLQINSTLAGDITVNGSSNGVTNSTNITFIHGEVNDYIVYCGNTCNRVVNQTVNLWVHVMDIYGNPIDGSTVNFNATPPDATEYNSPIWYNTLGFTPNISTTSLDGNTSIVIFRTDKRAGNNILNISTGSVNKIFIISGSADVPANLFLIHSPDFDVPANSKDKYLLKARVTDQFQNPVLQAGPPYTKKVHFYPSSIETFVLINEKGSATIQVGPTPYIETINISAFYVENGYTDTNISNYTNLRFGSGNLSRFVFYANPDSVMFQNGKKDNHNSTIFLKALDEWGHPVPGINVTLTNTNTTLGDLTADGVNGTNVINKVTDSHGGIQALFSSNISAGNDTIIAEYGSINASLNISIKDKTFISVNITFEPTNISTGQAVNVTTIISVEGETPVSRLSANAMLVLDNSGSMDPDYYAGTALDIMHLSDTSGSMDPDYYAGTPLDIIHLSDTSGSMDPDYYAGSPLDIMLVNDVSGSMDPNYYNAFWGTESWNVKGFTAYNYQASGSVLSHAWWSNNFTLNESVNDLKISVSNNNLRLQLISPSGKIYGYNGSGNNSPSYMWSDNMPGWYWDSSFNEWVWQKPYSSPGSNSYSYSPDTDFPDQGNWTVRVYNPTVSLSFSISSYIEKLSAVKISSKNFNKNLISNDRIGMVTFGGDPDTGAARFSLSALTPNISNINAAIDGLYASGGTPTADAIRNAKNHLVSNNRSGSRPIIILLSDGRPTLALDGSYCDICAKPISDATNEANTAKNTTINGNKIKIYAIGFGIDADNATMTAIASPGSYYYAASTSQLQAIYYNIAQQLSDFNITTRQYGSDGFTSYNYMANGTGNWSGIIAINDVCTDFKVQIDNQNLSFTLRSPNGTTYPNPAESGFVNRTGYYNSSNGRYIWITPVSGFYDPAGDNNNTIPLGNWNITVNGSGAFNITTYIDKKSAAKIASKAFNSNMISNDRIGLISFNDSTKLYNFSYNMSQMNQYIDSQPANSTTATAMAIRNATNYLKNNNRSGTRPIIILLSDGRPTIALDGSYCDTCAKPISDAKNESNITKNTSINGYYIKIYTIGFGMDADNATMTAIASPGSYYYAASTSQLQAIYYNISQQLSDFDITTRNYGSDGFTPYNYMKSASVNGTWSDTITINDISTDLKIQIDNQNLSFTLRSPNGTTYPNPAESEFVNRTGYYNSSNGRYIWITPVSGFYDPADDNNNTIPLGNWNITVNGSGAFNISTFIDKKSATKVASKVFNSNIISNDRVGLISFNDTINPNNLTYNMSLINQYIDAQPANGMTATAQAIKDATNYFKNYTRPGARPIIILLSDGMPTQSLGSGSTCNVNYAWCPTFDAINEANNARNAGIKIYAIGFGADADNEIMAAIASPGSSYYASTAKELEDIYNKIAQQISDFDITTRQYGIDGFTLYNYSTGIVNNSTYRSYNISLDDDVTDFKVQVDNPYVDFNLTSPDNIQYPRDGESGFVNRSGLYNVSNDKSKGQYLWLEPENNTYDPGIDKNKVIPKGTWTLIVTTKNNTNVTFNVTTYIDKISAVKAGSLAFISNFDAIRGDRAGLVRYSNFSKPLSNNQSSYVMNGSTWIGYFDNNIINTLDWNVTVPSSGNYLNSNNSNWTNSVPGVDQIRVHFVKIDVEANHDFINISDRNNTRVVSYTNLGSTYSGTDVNKREGANIGDVWSPWVNGDRININFSSDALYNYSGFKIDKLETMINCTFNLSWPNNTDTLDMNLYQGITPVKNSTRSGNRSTLNAAIYSDKSYYVEVKGTNISNETNFTINTTKNMNWFSYTANVAAPIEDSNTSKTFVGVNNAIGNMTADGLTAIDEGLFLANNQFPNNSIRPTIIIMTDGLDNAGYRSLLNEAYRARNNNTVINTIGFGSNESEVDNVTLKKIANITGGEYKFAPNTTELKSIFQGFASNLVKFSATNTTLNIRVPNNYISGLSVARLTYVTGSGNSTNSTNKSINFTKPIAPGTGGRDDPKNDTIGNTTLLSWPLPNLTVGDKWGIWYQLLVEGSGYIPLILEGSNVTYFSLDANQSIVINIINITNAGGADIGGNGASVSYIGLGDLLLTATPPEVFKGENSRITVSAKYTDGNPAIARVNLTSNLGYFNISENPLNDLMVSGSEDVNFNSNIAGKARINAWGRNGNNNVSNDLTIFVRPRGKITVN